MPTKRRRLGDLYVTGKPFTVADPEGGPGIDVWLQKLNPIEREAGVRRAGAERSRALAVLEDKESDHYQSTVNDVLDFYSDRETLVAFAMRSDLIKARARIEAEQAAEDKWAEDDYLAGLVESWQEEMAERYAKDPKDEEAAKVYEKIKEFDTEVNELVEAERIRLDRDHSSESLTKLRELAVEKLIEAQAIDAFVQEFENQRLLFGVREPDDHDTYYFKDRDEVRAVHPNIRSILSAAYTELEVDVIEGKDSPAKAGSSASSESSDKAETSDPSGPEVSSPSKTSPQT